MAVGARFAETIRECELTAADIRIVCSPSPEAFETAEALRRQLPECGTPVRLGTLDPAGWLYRSKEDAKARWQRIHEEIKAKLDAPTRALVVVGHDPQTSWLLHQLVDEGGRGQPGAGPLPLARGELAMLGGPANEPLALRWVLSPEDKDVVEHLQGKIKSKMDSAKLLGAFLTALLVLAARELTAAQDTPTWYPWVAGFGLTSLATATGIYFVTMFRYDELLMPVRFWPSPRRPSARLPRGFVRRPPSSAGWVLYQNMMRVWRNAFIPATVLGGVGTIAVTVALTRPHGAWWLAVAASIAGGAGVIWKIWHEAEPNLGVSD
jgi:hypothetical protein